MNERKPNERASERTDKFIIKKEWAKLRILILKFVAGFVPLYFISFSIYLFLLKLLKEVTMRKQSKD